jgi:hypothetical protein
VERGCDGVEERGARLAGAVDADMGDLQGQCGIALYLWTVRIGGKLGITTSMRRLACRAVRSCSACNTCRSPSSAICSRDREMVIGVVFALFPDGYESISGSLKWRDGGKHGIRWIVCHLHARSLDHDVDDVESLGELPALQIPAP